MPGNSTFGRPHVNLRGCLDGLRERRLSHNAQGPPHLRIGGHPPLERDLFRVRALSRDIELEQTFVSNGIDWFLVLRIVRHIEEIPPNARSPTRLFVALTKQRANVLEAEQ
jgi:hypothetical protein